MIADCEEEWGQRYLESLLEFDARLSSGNIQDEAPGADQEFPEVVRDRLNRARACVKLLQLRWRNRSTEPGEIGAPGRRPPSIPGYEIEGELGHGGMGVVYKARQLGVDRIVAIKLILAGAQATADRRQRFLQEARAMARLSGPHFVQLFEAGEADGVPYLVMEFVPGTNLADHCAGRPQPALGAARLVGLLARAIHSAHAQHIIHRDLKPGNVLLSPDGTPKITDFGLAKDLAFPMIATASGTMVGTMAYMAPEQVRGGQSVGPATDIYALGAVLYELLTGMPPYEGDSPAEIMNRVLHEVPISPRRIRPSVPRDLETICLRCLEKSPERRYATALHLADDLERFQQGRPVLARPISSPERFWRLCLRHPGVSAALAALVLATCYYIVHLRSTLRDVEHHLHFQTILAADGEWLLGHNSAANHLLEELPLSSRATWEWRHSWRRNHSYLQELPFVDAVWFVGISPDGRKLAAAGLEGSLRVFDLHSGRALPTPTALWERVLNFRFRPDGDLVCNSNNKDDISIWVERQGKFHRVLAPTPGHRHAITLAGDRIALAPPDGIISIRSCADGRELEQIRLEPDPWILAYSDDGRWLAAAPESRRPGTIHVLDAQTGTIVQPLQVDKGVSAVCFSHDGQFLAAGLINKDNRLAEPIHLVVWRWADRQIMLKRPLKYAVDGLVFGSSNQELFLLERNRAVHAIDVTDGEERQHLREDTAWCFVLSQDRRRLVTGTRTGLIHTWDLAQPQQGVCTLPCATDVIRAVAYHPKKPIVAAGGTDGRISLWDHRSAKLLRSWQAHETLERGVTSLVFTPDGSMLISGGADHLVNLWDPERGELLRSSLGGHRTFVSKLAVTPDGRLLASGAGDGTMAIWELPSGKAVRALHSDAVALGALAFSHDGRLLASGARELLVWDTRTWKNRPVSFDGTTALAFTADDQFLIAGNTKGKVKQINVTNLKSVRYFEGHGEKITGIALSPDGSRAVTSSDDKTLRLWETVTGRSILTLDGHVAGVECVAFSPNGTSVASGDWSGTVKIWQAPFADKERSE